jgi:CubicO group peptidase (beta-lactamase class C family)
MLANGGELNGVRLLEPTTIKLMTTNQIANKEGLEMPGRFGFGFGFHMLPDSKDVDEELRNAYAWFGFWSTSFRISPFGDWILITMSQTAWNPTTMDSFIKYEQLAAGAGGI